MGTNSKQRSDTALPVDDRGLVERFYVTPKEFVRLSGLSLATVRRYLANGRLPKFQPGGPRCRVLIPQHVLKEQCPPASTTDASVQSYSVGAAEISSSSETKTPCHRGPSPRWRERR